MLATSSSQLAKINEVQSSCQNCFSVEGMCFAKNIFVELRQTQDFYNAETEEVLALPRLGTPRAEHIKIDNDTGKGF